MGIFDMLRGWTQLEFQGVFPESVLNACAMQGIEFWDVSKPDPYTMRMKVRANRRRAAAAVIERCQCRLTVRRTRGGPLLWSRLKTRTALLLGAVLCAAALLTASRFVWEIQVVGNETLSTGEILRALQRQGVGIGSFWPAFSGDSLRNGLLLELPELRWAAVNYDCSRITVIVREKREIPHMADDKIPTHVVAAKPGVITELSVLQGAAVSGKGQTVNTGELLISGAVPSAMGHTRLEHALGTAQARTWYEIQSRLPLEYGKKVYQDKEKHGYALCIGGKRINFYRNSSISVGKCDKIEKEYTLSRENVFSLPVSWIRVTVRPYSLQPAQMPIDAGKAILEQRLRENLADRLTEGGAIRAVSVRFAESEGVLTAILNGECGENIAKEIPMTQEEIQKVRLEEIAGEETVHD